MNLSTFQSLGFTKGEARVYLALLSLGTTTTGAIILKSKVARSKVYELLERLKEKGLVSEFIKENTRYFQALSPVRILEYLKLKERALKEQQLSFKQLLPELLQTQQSKQSEQQVRVYEGFEGIKTLYLEMTSKLTSRDEYRGFTFPSQALKYLPVLRLIDNFHRVRAQKGAKAKILCTHNDIVNATKLKAPKNALYEYRVSRHPFPSSISIFQDTVATFIWEPTPRVFTIISKETAQHYRSFFDVLWKDAYKGT